MSGDKKEPGRWDETDTSLCFTLRDTTPKKPTTTGQLIVTKERTEQVFTTTSGVVETTRITESGTSREVTTGGVTIVKLVNTTSTRQSTLIPDVTTVVARSTFENKTTKVPGTSKTVPSVEQTTSLTERNKTTTSQGSQFTTSSVTQGNRETRADATEGVTSPTQTKANTTEGVTNPAKGTENTIEGVTNIAKGRADTTEGVTYPTKGRAETTKGVTNPMKGTADITESLTSPAKTSVLTKFQGVTTVVNDVTKEVQVTLKDIQTMSTNESSVGHVTTSGNNIQNTENVSAKITMLLVTGQTGGKVTKQTDTSVTSDIKEVTTEIQNVESVTTSIENAKVSIGVFVTKQPVILPSSQISSRETETVGDLSTDQKAGGHASTGPTDYVTKTSGGKVTDGIVTTQTPVVGVTEEPALESSTKKLEKHTEMPVVEVTVKEEEETTRKPTPHHVTKPVITKSSIKPVGPKKKCPANKTSDSRGSIQWPSTSAGRTVSRNCPISMTKRGGKQKHIAYRTW